MNSLAAIQVDLNDSTRDRWQVFAEHRRHVTELLVGDPVIPGGRLCVLGAGNCNDLDLPRLVAVHREVHLIDLDANALEYGVQSQSLNENPWLILHGGIDVTGMLDTMAAWSPATPLGYQALAACALNPNRLTKSIAGQFEVVASTCLLSQLIRTVVSAIGDGHPQFVEVMKAVRLGHLRLLAHLTAPGGIGLLVTDVVSSETFPPLASTPESELPGVLAQLIREHNFFHGTNPPAIAATFASDAELHRLVSEPELIGPWQWDMGSRVYAVVALRFRRKA